MGDFTSTELDGFVAVVTIDNPPMNQLSAPLLEELEAEIDRVRSLGLDTGGKPGEGAGACRPASFDLP